MYFPSVTVVGFLSGAVSLAIIQEYLRLLPATCTCSLRGQFMLKVIVVHTETSPYIARFAQRAV